MNSFRRIAKLFAGLFLLAGVICYIFSFTQHQGTNAIFDYAGTGKMSMVLGVVVLLVAFSTQKDTAGSVARKTSINILGVAFAFMCFTAAYAIYILSQEILNIFSIILVFAGVYLLTRILLGFRGTTSHIVTIDRK